MKKIAIVVPALSGGGGVPSVADFIYKTALKSRRYDPFLVSLSSNSADVLGVRLCKPSTWFDGIKSKNFLWHSYPAIEVGSFLSELEFQRFGRREILNKLLGDFDVIQVVCGSPAWGNAVLNMGKPVSLQVATRVRLERRSHSIGLGNPLGVWRKLMTLITDKYDDYVLNRVDAIQVENFLMLDYVRGLNLGKNTDIRYAPPGVDASVFHPIKRQNFINAGYILSVGRFDDPRKRIELLLESYALLPIALRKNIRLRLAGFSPPPKKFWDYAKSLDVVESIDFIKSPTVDELICIYQHARLFVLPSDEEGLGIVLLESMASGVPVISTRSGGPDGVITNGVDGFLVPLNDPIQMRDRMQLLLEDTSLNIKMGKKARETIEKRFDFPIVGEVFINIWDCLVKDSEKSICVD